MGVTDILLAIVGISILVIVHETGHYLAARAFGMRVLEYSIGFGPTLLKFQPKDSPTVFKVGAIPFLAYVRIDGMNPQDEVDPEDPAIYPNASVFGRIVTIAGGPFANYLAAVIFAFGIGLAGWPGWAYSLIESPVVIGQVVDDSAAAEAGLQVGDKIIMANGVANPTFQELIMATTPRADQETEYRVLRDGEELSFMITPRRASEEDSRGKIGVAQAGSEPFTIEKAARTSVIYPWRLTVLQLDGIADMFKKRSTENIGGPVAMGEMVGRAAKQGASHYFAMLMLLSVALGLFNLLPFPALDGGRLVFLGYEVITRRRPNEKFETIVHTVGLLFLLGVLVLVTFRDIFS